MRYTVLLHVTLLSVVLFLSVDADHYRHLGCFLDREETNYRDINGLDITKTDVNLHELLETCRARGYPYAGLQAIPAGGFKCYCGDSYGRWGKAANSAQSCNYTCTPNTNLGCGGILANDVYYTVRVDAAYTDTLKSVYHAENTVYVEARRQCVKNGGDLLTMRSKQEVNDSVSAVNDGGLTSGYVWFGLRNRFMNSSVTYEWVDHDLPSFSIASYTDYFKDNAILNPCVAVLPEYQLWKSTDCKIPYPYLCEQLAPELLTSPAPSSASDAAADEEGGMNLLSVYIVLPIFSFCYGGSCILYCVYKIYKNCKKKSKDKMLLTNIDAIAGHEYEPHTKPRPPPMARPCSGQGRIYPAPPNGMYPPRPSYGPPQYAKPPHPPPALPPRKPPAGITSPSNSTESPNGSRPATSRGVEINMKDKLNGTPRPDVPPETRPMSKAEKKREKLLDNALKEARERRGNGSGTPGKAREDPADSGDSTTNLLAAGKSSPPAPAVDRSKMPIGEILKLKMAEHSERKRAKKILQT